MVDYKVSIEVMSIKIKSKKKVDLEYRQYHISKKKRTYKNMRVLMIRW